MLDKISSAYFIDYLSVFDHKPLVVYCKKTTTDELLLLPKKKIVRYLEYKKEICHNNKFEILREEF